MDEIMYRRYVLDIIRKGQVAVEFIKSGADLQTVVNLEYLSSRR